MKAEPTSADTPTTTTKCDISPADAAQLVSRVLTLINDLPHPLRWWLIPLKTYEACADRAADWEAFAQDLATLAPALTSSGPLKVLHIDQSTRRKRWCTVSVDSAGWPIWLTVGPSRTALRESDAADSCIRWHGGWPMRGTRLDWDDAVMLMLYWGIGPSLRSLGVRDDRANTV